MTELLEISRMLFASWRVPVYRKISQNMLCLVCVGHFVNKHGLNFEARLIENIAQVVQL